GSFERELGETILGDLDRRTRLLHLPAQRLHLSDVEPGVMSDDDDIGGFKDTVERRDEFRLSRSIHCKLFPVDDPCPSLRLRPAALASRCTNAGRTALLKILPVERNLSRTQDPRFKPVAGLSAPKRSSPSMQATDIKPGNGTCSLGQDALPETAGSRRRARKNPRSAPAPFREIPQDAQKE